MTVEEFKKLPTNTTLINRSFLKVGFSIIDDVYNLKNDYTTHQYKIINNKLFFNYFYNNASFASNQFKEVKCSYDILFSELSIMTEEQKELESVYLENKNRFDDVELKKFYRIYLKDGSMKICYLCYLRHYMFKSYLEVNVLKPTHLTRDCYRDIFIESIKFVDVESIELAEDVEMLNRLLQKIFEKENEL